MKKKIIKPRNPVAAQVKQLGKRVVTAKKGKGSYSRKGRKDW